MSRQNIGDAALVRIRELEGTKDRSVLTDALQDQYVITMYDSATLVETAKIAALEALISRMPGMSDNMLIKTIEILSKIGEADMASITGSVQVKR
jgi:hypothetical protein